MSEQFYIGLMSGTSVDGIDAALVEFNGKQVQLLDFLYRPFNATLKQRILAVSRPDADVSLLDYGQLDAELGCVFAETALDLLDKTQLSASRIRAIGSHGQTVFHSPALPYNFSLQIGDPNRIAQMTGITTVADFRRRDMAAGGQGAPLAPAFHQAVFADPQQSRTVVNIGGIANISILDGQALRGFDTGPGNGLLDYWCQRHLQQAYDRDGAWAAEGQVDAELLATLLEDEYFQLPAPKSTGKEYFSGQWLETKLLKFSAMKAVDVQATLLELTVASIAAAIQRYAPTKQLTLVCGGGAYNSCLMQRLSQALTGQVATTDSMGVAADQVEAIAFAWLARQTLHNLAGNLCSVTGATEPVILGGIYPGRTGLSG